MNIYKKKNCHKPRINQHFWTNFDATLVSSFVQPTINIIPLLKHECILMKIII